MPLYIIHALGTDLVKIGFTTNDVYDRIQNIQTNCPYELACCRIFEHPGGYNRGFERTSEKRLHEHFIRAGQHSYGEWFRFNSTDLDITEALLKQWSEEHKRRYRSKHDWVVYDIYDLVLD